MFSFKNALGPHSFSQRPRHDLGTDGKKNLKFFDFFWNILTKSIWKKREPQNPDHTTQSDLHTFWLVLAMVFGEMNFVIWCCMLSHFLKKVFLQCRCYQGWFQYPSSWKPQAQLEKNWDPAFTFWSPVKNEHFRSMFVTCAFPGLKPIEFGKCFPSKMHWGHINFHRDQGMTLALMGKKIWNSLIFFWNILTKSIWKKNPQNPDHTTQSDKATWGQRKPYNEFLRHVCTECQKPEMKTREKKNLCSLSILSRLMPIAVLDVLEDFESRACWTCWF